MSGGQSDTAAHISHVLGCEHCAAMAAEAERFAKLDAFLDPLRVVARECGYTLGVHGSLQRDLDLVAVAWTPEAVSADQLVATLCEKTTLRERPGNVYDDGRVTDNPEPKPWGRIAWSLSGCPQPWGYVDLSVAPRAGEPVPLRSAE